MRPHIRQRTRIYLGCEGESEQSYGRLLQEIADADGVFVTLDCDLLRPGGGDPLALVQLALRRIREKVAKRGAFVLCAVLLDKDKLGQSPDRDGHILPLASNNKLRLIWQDPCHEGFLLRHLPEQTTMRPQNSGLATLALKKLWPEYSKPMTARNLAAKIDRDGVERAASVECDLRVFLQKIGFANEK